MSGIVMVAHFFHLLKKCLLLYVRIYLLIDKYIKQNNDTRRKRTNLAKFFRNC